MKKYEKFSIEELKQMCKQCTSYRELASKIGYDPNGGSYIKTIKDMVEKYDLDTSHFTGQSQYKNTGKHRTTIEKYLNNEVRISSHKLRLRLINENYFEKKCYCCGLAYWLGEEIPLELHHKDGNKNNNSLNNLELRCPNCHYFTETYKSKNRSDHKQREQ